MTEEELKNIWKKNTIRADWVIGVFTGDRAKSVKEHADAGIGYFIQMEEGRGMSHTVHAAFRRVADTPIPEHLNRATPAQVEKLEKLYRERTGQRERKIESSVSSTAEMMGVRTPKS